MGKVQEFDARIQAPKGCTQSVDAVTTFYRVYHFVRIQLDICALIQFGACQTGFPLHSCVRTSKEQNRCLWML